MKTMILYTVAEEVNMVWFSPECVRSSMLMFGQQGTQSGEVRLGLWLQCRETPFGGPPTLLSSVPTHRSGSERGLPISIPPKILLELSEKSPAIVAAPTRGFYPSPRGPVVHIIFMISDTILGRHRPKSCEMV